MPPGTPSFRMSPRCGSQRRQGREWRVVTGYRAGMATPVRVMLEQGKKKLVVACAFDWPGWDRSARRGEDVLALLATYRPRYARVAKLAGLADEFACTGNFRVVETVAADPFRDPSEGPSPARSSMTRVDYRERALRPSEAPTSAEITTERRRIEAEVRRSICAKVMEVRSDGSLSLCSLSLHHSGRHVGVPAPS